MKIKQHWDKDDLLRMITNPELDSDELFLKEGAVKIKRCFTLDGKSIIKKEYRKDLQHRNAHELRNLISISAIPSIHRYCATFSSISVPSMSEKFNFDTQLTLETCWRGFDLCQWKTLLGSKHPLLSSPRNFLALTRDILIAAHALHKNGIVHCDLHFGNIVIRPIYDTHSIRMKSNNISIIDFEFARIKNQFNSNVNYWKATSWYTPKGVPTQIAPNFHSDLVCADLSADRYSQTTRNPRSDEEYCSNLSRLDFGVDLYTLAQCLKAWEEEAQENWNFNFIKEYESEYHLIAFIIEELSKYNNIPGSERSLPHEELIRKIDDRIGKYTLANVSLDLQKSDKNSVRTEETLKSANFKKREAFSYFKDIDEDWFPTLVAIPIMLIKKDIISNSIRENIAVSKYPITIAQFTRLVEHIFSKQANPSEPATLISIDDVQSYLSQLSKKIFIRTGIQVKYRLLHEQEWYYCCTCGKGAPFRIGDQDYTDINPQMAIYAFNEANNAGYRSNLRYFRPANVTDPLNRRNSFGLHGMHGNVWEMVEAINDQVVLKGGGFSSPPRELNSHYSTFMSKPRIDVGFRMCRTMQINELI